MRLTRGEARRRRNLKDRGLDFVEAAELFAGPTFTFEGDRFACGQERLVTLGLPRDLTVSIVHTETPNRIHIISFRKATKHEQAIFFKYVQGRVGSRARPERKEHCSF